MLIVFPFVIPDADRLLLPQHSPRTTGKKGPRKLLVAGKGKTAISAEKQRAALGLDKKDSSEGGPPEIAFVQASVLHVQTLVLTDDVSMRNYRYVSCQPIKSFCCVRVVPFLRQYGRTLPRPA